MGSADQVTELLAQLRDEDSAVVLEKLWPIVYDELRLIAGEQMRHERPDHTLQPTELVHEAYVRLLGRRQVSWTDQRHFFRAASQAMRRILIEHGRRRGRLKRGGGRQRLCVNVLDLATMEDPSEILAVDDAIRRLERQDARMGQIVNLRFYAGLCIEDTAKMLNVSARTVRREWTLARAWLHRALTADESDPLS